ncbi:hypothetical protein [Flavobacterium sp. KACC 22761]|uniref:hypothetical protein n=1 Tax=Flavobacterium sp. KACC 22761 TaxID=3092665 RepID=UPI002A75A2CF|nr:hypothetical protein [Flavobacterium sp. KACC 22761]WPO77370.1 hypothetical protein SCB73_13960 [Flavobacterium sp. KACC 22761]
MKKIILVAFIVVSSFSCAKKVSPEKSDSQEVKEPKKEAIVGADSDEHGCKASAGYTWSVLRKKCIRVFENSTRLNHADDGKTYSTVSYVIFDGNKAELFLDTQKESIVLERKAEGDSWINGDWQLIPWKGYVLKKGEKILYTGQ